MDYTGKVSYILQVAGLVSEVEDLDGIRQDLVEENEQDIQVQQSSEEGFRLSKSTIRRRQSTPTGANLCSKSSLREHRKQTMEAACMIHGGIVNNTAPATFGMMETLEIRSKEAAGKSKKMKKKVIPKLYKDLVEYERSEDNMFR
jgi:hypothetical protein